MTVGSGQYHLAVAGGCVAVGRLTITAGPQGLAHPPATARWYWPGPSWPLTF